MESSVLHPSCSFPHISPPFSLTQPFNKAERIAQNMLSHHANVLILLCRVKNFLQVVPVTQILVMQLRVWS